METEDGTGYEPSSECFGCYSDSVSLFNSEILEPWGKATNCSEEDEVVIFGFAMGWQRQSGVGYTERNNLLEALTINGSYTITFKLEGDKLTAIRASHDEPTGATFTVMTRDQADNIQELLGAQV